MKNAIVIGGGFAGSLAAKKLEKKFNVTLIDTKNYFEFTPGVLRSIVKPEHVKKIQVLHSHYLQRAKIIIGKVEEVTKKYVSVNKRKIHFDYLVISSGSAYNSPFKEQRIVIATRADHLRNYHDELCKAKKILIIGGGPVGVELAGEIYWRYNDKETVMVHSKNRLIERNPESASKYAEKYLKKKGVKIIYNQKIKKIKDGIAVTNKGKSMKADIIFLCTGIKPNFELLSSFNNVLNEKNQVRVNEFLQINGFKNIFAAGDITEIKEEKTAQNAERQGRVVARNICSMEFGRELERYKSRTGPLVISLGKWQGIYVNKDYVMRGLIPGLMKWIVERKEMWKKRKL